MTRHFHHNFHWIHIWILYSSFILIFYVLVASVLQLLIYLLISYLWSHFLSLSWSICAPLANRWGLSLAIFIVLRSIYVFILFFSDESPFIYIFCSDILTSDFIRQCFPKIRFNILCRPFVFDACRLLSLWCAS